MKTLLLLGSTLLLSQNFAQTSLFLEDFETGGASFTINSTDMSSVANSSQNDWLINNTYAGGSGTFVCMGFPFNFTVPATPSQPGGIGNGPNSNYLHISADAAVASGVNCASYIPADGTCNFAENHFAKMTGTISTTGMNNVNADFWWLCGGSPQAYGEVYYSLDNGATWVLQQTSMQGQTSWTNAVITNALWSNQPSLKFGFRFVNSTSNAGADPAFSLDDFEVFATAIGANAITTTNDVAPASWCFNSTPTGTVNFNSTGTFTAGNVYTAQLSDAAGSFAAPTSIGTLSSTASGALSIATSIPSGIAVGTGYRVRVVSSNPATTGTDNTSNLIINALPTVTMGALSDVCVYNSAFSLTQGAPASGTYSGTGVSGGAFTPSTAGIGAHTITYAYTDANSCMNTANTTINVNACASIDELNTESFFIIPNPVETSFQIVGIDAESKVELVDFSGKLISNFSKGQDTFDVSNLSEGIYIVRITNGTETVLTKLIKK